MIKVVTKKDILIIFNFITKMGKSSVLLLIIALVATFGVYFLPEQANNIDAMY